MPHTPAFHEGISAFEADQKDTANPHRAHSRAARQWLDGWRFARDEFIYSDADLTGIQDNEILFETVFGNRSHFQE